MPNTVLSRTVFSDEKVVFQDDRTIISTNDYFTRYIRIASDELRPTGKKFRNFKGIKNFLSAFWYSNSIMKTTHVIDNIYIDDAYRRQGIASWLIERAFSDFPDLCLDGRFTTEGISFFGAKHRKK
jgi:GNAT superfamily N-acetyltransferase